MSKKTGVCFFLILSCAFCSIADSFAYDFKPCAPQTSSQSGKSLKLVFCSLNYPDPADFAKDREVLIQRLKRTRPFDEFTDVIKVWKIGLLDKKEAELSFKKIEEYPFLNVHRDFLERIFNFVNSNYKLIIIDASGSISAAQLSSAHATSLIILGRARYRKKESFANGFLHELGHSLGLRDEGLNEHASRCSPGYPNCATTKEEARQWWGDLALKEKFVGYINGCCGNKDYIRPTIASFMNDPDQANDFGPVNERYLRKVLEGLQEK